MALKSLRIAVLAAFLPALAFGQALAPGDKDINLGSGQWSQCGLVTRYSPNLLQPNCFQSVANVLFDSNGSMDRRNGYAAYNLTACTGSQPIKGLWPFFATDGTKYLIAFSSNSLFYSNGDGTCKAISALPSLCSTCEMQCVQAFGQLNCTDGTDAAFQTDVNSTATLTGAPAGTLISSYQNRLVMAGVSGNQTYVYLSGFLNAKDWTLNLYPNLSTSPVQIPISNNNDGAKINCLMGTYQGCFYVGRDYDLYQLCGESNQNFTLTNFSREVGCVEPKSIQEVNNVLYWLSKRGAEALTGTQINPVSYPIEPTINQIIAAAGNSRSLTLTSQADWQSGNLTASGPGAAMSATISPGDVVPTTWSVTTSGLGADGLMIDVDTTTNALGKMTNFDGGNLNSNGVVWTAQRGNIYPDSNNRVTGSTVPNGNYALMTTTVAITTGTWSFTYVSTIAVSASGVVFTMVSTGTDYTAVNSASVRVTPLASLNTVDYCVYVGSVGLASPCTFNPPGAHVAGLNDGTAKVFAVTKSTQGFISISVNGVIVVTGTDTYNASTTTYTSLRFNSGGGSNEIAAQHVGHIILPYMYDNQVSSIYDTSLATPTWGTYAVAMTSMSTSSVTFSVQASTANDGGGFQALVSQSSGVKIVAANKRYIRHHVFRSAPESVSTSSVTTISLLAETTGYYITQCVQASTPSAWGNFNVDGVTNGGSFTFYLSTGGTCAATQGSTATWTTQTANSAIVVSTATNYIAARVLFTIDVATEVPTLNDITFNWNNGSSRPPTASASYKDRYYLFYTTSTTGTPVNDHAAVFDYNKKWTLFDDINAYSATLYLNQLYTGDSNSTGKIFLQDSGQSDNGGNFTESFTTPDLDGGDPWSFKQFKRAYFMISAPNANAAASQIACNYSLDGSTKTYSLNYTTITEAPESTGYYIAKFPFAAGTPNLGHWINLACSYVGANGPLSIYGIKIVYTPQNWP